MQHHNWRKGTMLIGLIGCAVIAIYFTASFAQTSNGPKIMEFTFSPEAIAPGENFEGTINVSGELEKLRISVNTRPLGKIIFPLQFQLNKETGVFSGMFPPVIVPQALENQTVKLSVIVYDSQRRYDTTSKSITLKPNLPPRITGVAPDDGGTFTANNVVSLTITAEEPTNTKLEYQFTVDGVVKSAWGDSATFEWHTTTNNSGLHAIIYQVRNKFQKEAENQIEIYGYRQPINPPTLD